MATQAKRDYYEVLGISRSASEQQIKSSYRKLAMQHHPDRNPGDPHAEEKFKECTEAYSVLIDSNKRARYDQFGHAGVDGGSGFGGFDPSAFGDFTDIFGDIFGDLFGVAGGRRSRGPQRGGDARADLTLTFEEAAFGKKTQVKVRRYETCEQCRGTGAAPGKGATACSTCHGRGQVRYQQGFFSIARTCPACQGAGRVISDPCLKCKGESRMMRERTVDVTVPAGVEDGTRIRYQGQGDSGPGTGSIAGDLYVVLHVKAHSFFEREGKDLYCSVPISFSQAALGDEILIPTLDGDHRLKVPEGTQSGTTFRVRGKGIPVLQSSGKGDLFVKVRVQTPSRLSRRQRELLEELRGTSQMDNKPEPRSLLDKVKEIFG
ncbi:MAG TPA: molecular chaperone DnaJ [Candidatus Angelobacter sp.]|nr:molecular chaperone DnaJ [Candidatus Angelobacter sp.]